MPEGVRDPSSHRTPAQIREMDRGYNSRPEMIKRRTKNNQARKMMVEEGRVRKGDGKDVDHKKPLRDGGSNYKKNLRVIEAGRNRGWRDGV